MLTMQHYTTKKTKEKQKKNLLHSNPKPFSDSSLPKEHARSYNFIKRLSPFLVSAILFPPFALYSLIEGIHLYQSMILQLFIFSFIEVYFLFLDFVLWNYFQGRKVFRIWVIELTCESALLYLML